MTDNLIGPEYVDEANMVSVAFFVDENGNTRDHVLETLAARDRTFPFYYLPHHVSVPGTRTTVERDAQAAEYRDYLRVNSVSPWMRWSENQRLIYIFQNIRDAVAFRLYVEEP